MGVGVDTERRARRVFLGLLVFLGALVLRAGYIQLVRGEEFAARARQMHFKQIAVPAPRGSIFDRHGRPLVASYHACSVAADPQEVEDAAAFATSVAFLLGEPNAGRELAGKIEGKRRAGKRFVYLRRRIDRDLATHLRASDLAGLDVREEPRREYPHGGAAAALLGAVGADEHGRITGLTGLEHRFDAFLRGTDGTRSVFRSGRRESLHLFPERAQLPQAGGDVFTTLDIVLQQIVEDALDGLQERHRPKCSSAVALDPRTGEILALASRPSLDPDAFPDVSAECLRVPAAQCSYEPGSTFKPLVCAWALTRGAVREDEVFDCGRGARFFGGRRLRDVRPHGHLPLEMILVKSSNIGIAQVGQALGIDEAFRYLHLLGFGRRTGVEIEGEQPGKITPRGKWHRNYTLVSVAMGHEVAATPLQLAVAYSALANGGDVLRPRLLRGATETVRRIPFDPAALRFVRRAMVRVVEEGTGRRARVRGLRLAGKTGTCEKYPEGSGRYVASFVGIAPADDPRLLVLVVADEPRTAGGLKPYGGVVAAPVVGEIFRNALPLLHKSAALSESGVRQPNQEPRQGKVRVAAVHRSSVWVGERDFPAASRNPDSAGAASRQARQGR
ncbi:MAG: peptidoglycan D,D-transpeptidase FtsI family protein [Planctomycetota bacterium]|jgi:cell division protein FtsI/penicillin-binding protein 2